MNCPLSRDNCQTSKQPAGQLYQPGDYKAAADLTRELVTSPGKRRSMAAAGRQEVEAKGWLSAIQRIRDKQYQRAIRTFKAHKRCAVFSKQKNYLTCDCQALPAVASIHWGTALIGAPSRAEESFANAWQLVLQQLGMP